jgi:hypothetical protein
MLQGSLRFAIVSLAGFAVWAFGGKWFQTHLGEAGLYAACTVVFLGGSGLLLSPLVEGPGAFKRFYAVFIPAFFAYAFVWCAAWFILHFGLGEWLGSFLGTTAFAAIIGWRLRNLRGLGKAMLVLFVCHSAGYFLGGRLMHWLFGPTASAMFAGLSKYQIGVLAKLSWGLLYGLGFGAGIGYAFHMFQHPQSASVSPTRA